MPDARGETIPNRISTPSRISAPSTKQATRFISEAEIRDIMKEFYEGSENLNLNGAIDDYAAPFVIGEFQIYMGATTLSTTVEGKDALRASFEDAYSELIEIEHLSRSLVVSVSDNGQMAVADDESIVSMTGENGISYLVLSTTRARFALVNGEVMMTSIESDSNMNVRPGLLPIGESNE
jgi:hypothetical protein